MGEGRTAFDPASQQRALEAWRAEDTVHAEQCFSDRRLHSSERFALNRDRVGSTERHASRPLGRGCVCIDAWHMHCCAPKARQGGADRSSNAHKAGHGQGHHVPSLDFQSRHQLESSSDTPFRQVIIEWTQERRGGACLISRVNHASRVSGPAGAQCGITKCGMVQCKSQTCFRCYIARDTMITPPCLQSHGCRWPSCLLWSFPTVHSDQLRLPLPA